MKRRSILIIAIALLLILAIIIVAILKTEKKSERIVVEGLFNFQPSKSEEVEESYLLFYPSDPRVDQSFTLVKEVNTNGETLKEYEVRDHEFRRMTVFQKPNQPNQLFISFFGVAAIDNWFYTYDVEKRKFAKKEIPYFHVETGVGHIRHYGPQVLFQTILSHETGDQNYDSETGNFNLSISNYATRKSYETEPGYVPNGSPILQFDKKIIYSGSGPLDDEGMQGEAFVAIVDSEDESVLYKNFDERATEYYPMYVNEEHAYILDNIGNMYILDKDLNFTVTEIFNHVEGHLHFYNIDGEGTLFIDKETALHTVYDESFNSTIGLMSFKGEPSFTVLSKNYFLQDHTYRMLYQDVGKGEIYLIETDRKKKGSLIVLDNETFDLKHRIPVDYHHLLDFVIKSE